MTDIRFYHDKLMDYYRHPRNCGRLSNPTIQVELSNPSCGDSIAFDIMLQDDKISSITFYGKGCVISQATASLLTEYVLEKTLSEVIGMKSEVIVNLIGIPLGPTRLRCALLSLEALQQGVSKHA